MRYTSVPTCKSTRTVLYIMSGKGRTIFSLVISVSPYSGREQFRWVTTLHLMPAILPTADRHNGPGTNCHLYLDEAFGVVGVALQYKPTSDSDFVKWPLNLGSTYCCDENVYRWFLQQ